MLYTYKINSYLLLAVVCVLFTPNVLQARTYFPIPQADSINIQQDTAITAESLLPANELLNDSVGNLVPTDIATDSIASDSIVIKRGKTKKEKEKTDTLSTYFFSDSLRKGRIISWTLNRYLNSYSQIIAPDTLQSENLTELPFYIKDVGVSYLGVTGSASLLHNFFKREQSDIFPFIDPYSLYTNTPDKLEFYNTKGPFSNLSYYTSGNKRVAEDNLEVVLTQNVNPSLNVGMHYRKMGAKGIYQNQRTKDKTFSLFTSYIGKRYVAHAGYIYNGIDNNENGGIVNDFFLTDTIIESTSVDTKLKTAANSLSSNTYFLTHSYGLPLNLFNKDSLGVGEGTIVYFGHTFEYARYKRIYTDGIADTAYLDLYGSPDYYQYYYKDNYMSYIESYDSTFTSKLDNRVFIRLQPYSATAIISKIDAGLGYSFDKYYGYTPGSYLYKQNAHKPSTGYVYGNAQGMFSKYFSWDAFLKYHFAGYKINDLYFDAKARLSLYPMRGGVHLTGRFLFDNKEQPYFIQQYYSNHFKWNNNFDKTTETRIEAMVSVPDWNLEIGFKNSIISKYVYFGNNALPNQASDVLNVTSLHLDSKLKWWILRLDTRLVFQNTSNSNILPLPAISGNVRFYQETEWVKNVLNSRIGVDVYYNTNFYDYAYNPATGMFHTQSEKKLGNYPWIDVFASFKWKRANIYAKFTNAGAGIIGERNYFSALHYPRNKRMLRIGVNWYFHN